MRRERWNPLRGGLAIQKPLEWSRKPRLIELRGDLFAEGASDELITTVFGVMAASAHHTFRLTTRHVDRALAWFREVEEKYSERTALPPPPHLAKYGVKETEPLGVIDTDWIVFNIKSRATNTLGSIEGSWFGPCADCGLDVRADKKDPLCFKAVAWPLPHVWIGVEVHDQQEAERDIPTLLEVPAANYFVRCVPKGFINFEHIGNALFDRRAAIRHMMRGPARLNRDQAESSTAYPELGWVTCAGETGKDARPLHPDWVRSIRDQCRAAGVPFCFEGWGEWCTLDQRDPEHASDSRWPRLEFLAKTRDCVPGRLQWIGEFDEEVCVVRARKKLAGRELDGKVWDEQPRKGEGR